MKAREQDWTFHKHFSLGFDLQSRRQQKVHFCFAATDTP